MTGPDADLPIGDIVRGLRRRRGLTQQELADASGLSIGYIRALERGEPRQPSVRALRKLADALGVTAAVFVDPDARPAPGPVELGHYRPLRPSWLCPSCGRSWPCETRRQVLTIEYEGTPYALLALMQALMVYAAGDLHDIEAGALHERFVAWVPRRPGRLFGR